MLMEGGRDHMKGMESRFFHLVVPACHGQACGVLDRVPGKLWIWKRSMTRLAFGNAVRTIPRMESDRSSVTSSTALRRSSPIRRRTVITSSTFVPATTATRDRSRVFASRLVTNVYSSPLESEDSSMASRGPMFSGNSSHSSACASWLHCLKPLSASL